MAGNGLDELDVHACGSSVRKSPGGELYEVDIRVEGLNGELRPVTTVWLVADEGEPPTLLTAYVGGAGGSA